MFLSLCFFFFFLWTVVTVPQAFLSSPLTVLLMCRLFLLANKYAYIVTNIHTNVTQCILTALRMATA